MGSKLGLLLGINNTDRSCFIGTCEIMYPIQSPIRNIIMLEIFNRNHCLCFRCSISMGGFGVTFGTSIIVRVPVSKFCHCLVISRIGFD